MKRLANLVRQWWQARRPKRADEMLVVTFDEHEIQIRALEGMSPEWNQSLSWSNIKRVCWKDGGIYSSDMVYISRVEPDSVFVFPTEARGGDELFGALCERGFFPEHLWRQALGSTNGGMYCWPPATHS